MTPPVTPPSRAFMGIYCGLVFVSPVWMAVALLVAKLLTK